jgi:hypothetical protein
MFCEEPTGRSTLGCEDLKHRRPINPMAEPAAGSFLFTHLRCASCPVLVVIDRARVQV